MFRLGKYALTLVGLIVGCGIQVPLFFEFVRRFMNFFIDPKTTHEDFFISMLYGDNPYEGNPYEFKPLFETLSTIYIKSLSFLVIFIVAHLILFLEHDWVSRDSGFKKLVNKNIGRLVNVNEAIARRLLNPQQRIGLDRNPNLENLLRRENAAPDDEDFLAEPEQNPFPIMHPAEEDSDEDDDDVNELPGAREHLRADQLEAVNDLLRQLNGQAHIEDRRVLNQVPDIPNVPHPEVAADFQPFPFPIRAAPVNPQRELQAAAIAAAAQDAVDQRQPFFMRPENNDINPNNLDNEDAAVAAAAAQIAGGDGILENLPVHIIIFAADTLLAVYLSFAYLVPYVAGNLIFHLIAFAVNAISPLLPYSFIYPVLMPLVDNLNNLKKLSPAADEFLQNSVIHPLISSMSRVYNQDQPLNSNDRLIPLFLFYGILYGSILKYLSVKAKKHNDDNPLKGFQRKIYILLFDLVCTLKVFTIFGIELIVFPTFCGLLIEFVLTPFFHSDSKLLLNTFSIFSQHVLIRIVSNWSIGTLYMCLFALFVGMARRYIIRSGVLFFIRSPEDPNARLVHDALVRPLSLQLSRISLSAFVYTLFILIGLGFISYGLRVIKSPLIPISIDTVSTLAYGHHTYFLLFENLELLKKYIRQFWSRAFKSACTQTRLSSFILGTHNPRERGYVVYKSFLSRFKKNVKPDYSEPKLYSEAVELLKDPSNESEAYFIPDGNLIRAPKNDIVSRKFVKTLFISVTKDDKPLKKKAELDSDLAKFKIDEFDESEDELTITNQYEIVYRPPLFGFRIILFILMLWVFSVILIGGVGLVSNFIGRPIILLHYLPMTSLYLQKLRTRNKFFDSAVKMLYTYDGPNYNHWTLDLDIGSISVGLFFILKALKKYDEYLIRKHLEDGDEVVVEDNAPLLFGFDDLNTICAGLVSLCLRLAAFTLFIVWNFSLHENAINTPYNYYYGIKDTAFKYDNGDGKTVFYTFDKFTVVLHLIVFLQNNYYVLRQGIVKTFLNQHDDDIVILSIDSLKYVLKNVASTHVIPMLFNLSLVIFEFNQHRSKYLSFADAVSAIAIKGEAFEKEQIYIWPAYLILLLGIKNFRTLVSFLKKVNSEVKEQYYSKGKTLENTKLDDETEGEEGDLVY